jgi:hypothetical protein
MKIYAIFDEGLRARSDFIFLRSIRPVEHDESPGESPLATRSLDPEVRRRKVFAQHLGKLGSHAKRQIWFSDIHGQSLFALRSGAARADASDALSVIPLRQVAAP